jgi:hypothetical protein
MCVHVCKYVYAFICVHVCKYVYMYICIYMYNVYDAYHVLAAVEESPVVAVAPDVVEEGCVCIERHREERVRVD